MMNFSLLFVETSLSAKFIAQISAWFILLGFRFSLYFVLYILPFDLVRLRTFRLVHGLLRCTH